MHGSGTLTFGSNTTKGVWENGQLIINTLEEFVQLNPFLKQKHRYQTSKLFEYSLDDEEVNKYIGEVKILYNGETVQFLRDGEGVLTYTNGQENRGTWKEDKILVRKQTEYDSLQPFLKDNQLYDIVGNEKIVLDSELQDCIIDKDGIEKI